MRKITGVWGAILISLIFVGVAGDFLMKRIAKQNLINEAESSATTWVRHFSARLNGFDHILFSKNASLEEVAILDEARHFVDVFRFKLFDSTGRLLMISDDITGESAVFQNLADHNSKAFQVIRTGKPYTEIEDGRYKDNRPDYYAETYMPIIKDKHIIGVVEVYLDITSAYTSVHRSFYLFEAVLFALFLIAAIVPSFFVIVSMRRLNASNKKLKKARDAAWSAEQAKGRFLANMSHEIRTPMNGIMGMAELLNETELNAEQRGFSDTIVNSAGALLGIINDILDFSKVEAGKMSIIPAPFDLNGLLQDAAALLSPVAEGKGLEICVDCRVPLPAWFVGDAARLRQCLLNIAGNAVKFTETGHIVIAADIDTKGQLTLSVTDTGVGISEDKLGLIFSAFEQVENDDTRRFDGTGLGLAITERLTKLMGGSVSVASEPGKGSRFDICLALERAEEPTEAFDYNPGVLKGKHALIVDDLETNRRILTARLATWGMTSVAVSSAREALKVLQPQKGQINFDIAILDYCMPEMTGEGLFEEMQKDPALAELPAVILSSGELSSMQKRLSDLGLKATVNKPVRTEVLARMLIQAMDIPMERSKRPKLQNSAEIEDLSLLKGFQVLLAEDNKTNQIVVKKMLTKQDVDLVICEDGQEALKRFSKVRPDLILMDMSMPVMDGLTATKEIRAIEQKNNQQMCPIVALTANAMPEDQQKCLNAGMNGYLAKPLVKNDLLTCLVGWAQTKQGTQVLQKQA